MQLTMFSSMKGKREWLSMRSGSILFLDVRVVLLGMKSVSPASGGRSRVHVGAEERLDTSPAATNCMRGLICR
jgi:hypothetical protein